MPRTSETRKVKMAKNLLLVLLCLFSAASVIFSVYVLFGDISGKREISPAQSRGIFTAFIYEHVNEVHPQAAAQGRSWQIRSLDFPNNNLAVVETTDGETNSKLEFIYVIEYPNVRVMKINNVTGRDLQDANLTLLRFLNFLESGDYENAAALYGGPVAKLASYGGESSTLPKLLEAYCAQATSAKKCLEFSITHARKDLDTFLYRFTVTYQLPDSTQLTLPDGTKEFAAIVEATDAKTFKVTSLPFDH